MSKIQNPKRMIRQQLCQKVLIPADHGLQSGAIRLRWMFCSFGFGILFEYVVCPRSLFN